jgi:UDP-3-O-[3-hydroxymyristoyl] N-acetylglucosamine deacetylase
MRRGVVLSTCEHLLSALRGSGVDNCFIDIDNIELPICDGSSEDFVELIERAGTVEQDAPKRVFRVLKNVALELGDRRMSIGPAENFEIDCLIEFPHPWINRQSFKFVMNNGSFGEQIASARTFGFTSEIDELRKANLAQGGSLGNAIVLTEDGMLNDTPLRFDDEFVRHKILDIIGDLALLGMPIQGRVTAEKSGHSVHAQLMSKLLKTEDAWEIVDADQLAQSAV